jgi:flagellar biosynthesis/type III secretory pathway protein FliH
MAAYADMTEFTRLRDFDYEDLDTRDQNVVRTMAQAEAKSREMLQKAQADGFAITEAAQTEAQGLVAEARVRAGAEAEVYAETLRQEAAVITSEAESRRGEIESLQAAAEQDRAAAKATLAEAEAKLDEAGAIRLEAETIRQEAETVRQEAETHLAAVKDRIAGLDQEQQKMEAATEVRRRELEAEHQGRTAELAARRGEVLAEAKVNGQKEGYDQGLAKGLGEGRAAGRAEVEGPWLEKTARLADLLGRMENLYQDLWRANGPMMVQLAIEGAEGILNKELKSAGDLAVRAFEACIDYLGQAHRVVFQARPQDIPLLEEARAEQRQRLGALVKVSFQPDERLGPGDLIMESDVGRLDATVKHRAAQVMSVLREAFENAQVFEPPAGRQAEAEPEPAQPEPTEPEPAEPEPDGGDDSRVAQAAPDGEKPEPEDGGDTVKIQAAPDDQGA